MNTIVIVESIIYIVVVISVLFEQGDSIIDQIENNKFKELYIRLLKYVTYPIIMIMSVNILFWLAYNLFKFTHILLF